MAEDKLTDLDLRLYRYLVEHDFTKEVWNTEHVAREFGVSPKEIYESLSKLAKLKKDNIWIYYENGRIKIAAE